MPRISVTSSTLHVELSPFERLASLVREVKVPLEHLRSARVAHDPWQELRGLRVGTAVPRLVARGRFYHRGGRDFVFVRRGEQAVVVELDGDHYARLVLGTHDGAELVERLTAAASRPVN
jgi:hypothetical protein